MTPMFDCPLDLPGDALDKSASTVPEGSDLMTFTSLTRATAPPCSCTIRLRLILRYRSVSRSPWTVWARAS